MHAAFSSYVKSLSGCCDVGHGPRPVKRSLLAPLKEAKKGSLSRKI
jgi:hypothetical protein